MVVPCFSWWLLSQHSPRLSSSWPISAHDRSAWLSTWFLYGTSSLTRRSLTPSAPHSQKIARLTEEWWEMMSRVGNFGVRIPTFMSFFYFWLHKCFQIIVQYWEWTKPAIIVEIVWVSLCMMQFWLTYQCSSFDRCLAAETRGSFPVSVHQNFFRVFVQELSVLHCHSCFSVFFLWPNWVCSHSYTFFPVWVNFAFLISFVFRNSSVFPAECLLLLRWQDEAFSLQVSCPCLGCWFLNSIFMFMERNIMLVPHSSSSFQLMPLNCSTTKAWH